MAKYLRLQLRAATLVLILSPLIAGAADQDSGRNVGRNVASLELGPGVIVDLKEKHIYLMTPERSVEAVNIGTGKTLWSTGEAAKPLGVGNGLLVCQADAPAPSSTLNLVVLNAQSGRTVTSGSVALPAQVVAQVDDSLSNKFSARAVAIGDDAFVSWEDQAFPVRGMPPSPDETARVRTIARQAAGTVKFDVRSGRGTLVEPAAVPKSVLDARPMNLTGAPGAPIDTTQRISIDGRHTLKSKLVGNDSVWDKYEWTIMDNTTDQAIGQVRSHLSQSGFVVADSLIVFETGPFVRKIGSRLVNEPLMLRAVDLRSGNQVWNRRIRDTTYRGPFPP
jgi:PQQ-like domain